MADETLTLVMDVEAQTLVGVLAQWCGALGFWMGLSAATVFELMQLLHDVIESCSCYIGRNKPKPVVDVLVDTVNLSTLIVITLV